MYKTLLAASICALAASRADAAEFAVSSNDLASGKFVNEQILDGFGCTGNNRSPQIAWEHEPAGTRSFVITIYDPDAPTGSGWWHWVVANVPADVHALPKDAGKSGQLPAAALQVRTDFGKPAYGGPCPPAGETHRYVITVNALKVDKIDVTADSSAALVGFLVHANLLAKATLTATFGR